MLLSCRFAIDAFTSKEQKVTTGSSVCSCFYRNVNISVIARSAWSWGYRNLCGASAWDGFLSIKTQIIMMKNSAATDIIRRDV